MSITAVPFLVLLPVGVTSCCVEALKAARTDLSVQRVNKGVVELRPVLFITVEMKRESVQTQCWSRMRVFFEFVRPQNGPRNSFFSKFT